MTPITTNHRTPGRDRTISMKTKHPMAQHPITTETPDPRSQPQPQGNTQPNTQRHRATTSRTGIKQRTRTIHQTRKTPGQTNTRQRTRKHPSLGPVTSRSENKTPCRKRQKTITNTKHRSPETPNRIGNTKPCETTQARLHGYDPAPAKTDIMPKHTQSTHNTKDGPAILPPCRNQCVGTEPMHTPRNHTPSWPKHTTTTNTPNNDETIRPMSETPHQQRKRHPNRNQKHKQRNRHAHRVIATSISGTKLRMSEPHQCLGTMMECGPTTPAL